jgi:hypothetical protein
MGAAKTVAQRGVCVLMISGVQSRVKSCAWPCPSPSRLSRLSITVTWAGACGPRTHLLAVLVATVVLTLSFVVLGVMTLRQRHAGLADLRHHQAKCVRS